MQTRACVGESRCLPTISQRASHPSTFACLWAQRWECEPCSSCGKAQHPECSMSNAKQLIEEVRARRTNSLPYLLAAWPRCRWHPPHISPFPGSPKASGPPAPQPCTEGTIKLCRAMRCSTEQSLDAPLTRRPASLLRWPSSQDHPSESSHSQPDIIRDRAVSQLHDC